MESLWREYGLEDLIGGSEPQYPPVKQIRQGDPPGMRMVIGTIAGKHLDFGGFAKGFRSCRDPTADRT
jgi:hypothetical protein